MSDLKDRIPKQSLGLCHWCGAESQRLNYLMCPNCSRIYNLVPSKVMVRMNSPEAKKRVQDRGGATVHNIAPEARDFILDPKSRFPPQTSDQEHWAVMKEEAVDRLQPGETRERLDELRKQGIHDASVEQVEIEVAVQNILKFMIVVATIRGQLKFDVDPDSEKAFEQVCEDCLENVVQEGTRDSAKSFAAAKPEITRPAPRAGMNISDMIKKRR